MSASQQLLEGVAKRREAASLLQQGLHDQAIAALREAAAIYASLDEDPTQVEAHAEALDALSGVLRRQGRVAEALERAEQALRIVTKLAREDAPRYLALLARLTDNFGRCCQRLDQFERAAEAYEQAVHGYAILAELGTDRDRLELAEVMSRQALALAQIGQADQLERAHVVASAFVELSRELLPCSLPLLAGGLLFLADLAGALDRPSERVAHLADGVRVLERAVELDMPGAGEAAARMNQALRDAVTATGLPMP